MFIIIKHGYFECVSICRYPELNGWILKLNGRFSGRFMKVRSLHTSWELKNAKNGEKPVLGARRNQFGATWCQFGRNTDASQSGAQPCARGGATLR